MDPNAYCVEQYLPALPHVDSTRLRMTRKLPRHVRRFALRLLTRGLVRPESFRRREPVPNMLWQLGEPIGFTLMFSRLASDEIRLDALRSALAVRRVDAVAFLDVVLWQASSARCLVDALVRDVRCDRDVEQTVMSMPLPFVTEEIERKLLRAGFHPERTMPCQRRLLFTNIDRL